MKEITLRPREKCQLKLKTLNILKSFVDVENLVQLSLSFCFVSMFHYL